jgi:pilus assembly protein Flp/PilA
VNWTLNVRNLLRRDEGQDLIEYALLVGLISLVAVVALTATGTSVTDIFTSISAKLAAAT